MNRLHEPLQRHIHDDLCSEVNNAIISIKIHHSYEYPMPEDQRLKIEEAKKRTPEIDWRQVVELLSKVRDEMNQCKEPYKRY